MIFGLTWAIAYNTSKTSLGLAQLQKSTPTLSLQELRLVEWLGMVVMLPGDDFDRNISVPESDSIKMVDVSSSDSVTIPRDEYEQLLRYREKYDKLYERHVREL
jgi:hypothetical protein